MIKKVSVIGLGKLGASMAAVFASRGVDVIGVDIHQNSVDHINEGKAPVQETGLNELLQTHKSRIKATLSHEEAVLNSEISFVIVPTPSNENGAFSLQYAGWAFKEIGKALAKKNAPHNVVLTSTVMPGSVRQILIPILEKESGKKANQDFGVCYSPEFIALGSIIHDFLNPDFTLIGEISETWGTQLEKFYAQVLGAKTPPVARMSLESAELTKIAINTYVTTKITYANMIAEICEKLPYGNVDDVSFALGLDSRIGRKYLTGAIGYGGPCFPRDNVALGYLATQLGIDASLAHTVDNMNRSIAQKVVKKIEPLLTENATIAVLGLAYKPFSHIIDESQGVEVAKALSKAGWRVISYDPMYKEMPINELNKNFIVLSSIEDCLKQAEAVLITTPDPAFKSLTAQHFKNEFNQVLVVDFWRILQSKLSNEAHIKYVAIGLSENDEANNKRLLNMLNK